ncbi:MAG: DNA polymerase III subunit delta [Bacteroidales bacterium]|jgi:DNA polymerase-3 subunit delta|nr:DNA polymerase III subunit delta [Bacteroidales bacterium]MDD2770607.1 DNA polymerase III subunit delta [Bacteroidales bacterium]MDD3549495.1 DNA polymerase III subunit delta [Bacteroidales bacterium]MDD4064393.1 DNA polymerase III subunit delta [Bacteroidales bacterium]MDD4499011.1 DNA polymerase III subunit delta [Bacteroidales bacterium]
MAKTNAKDSYSAYREIIKELKAGAFKPCYLLMGEEPYYVDKIASYIALNALTEDEKAFNQMVLYGQDVTSAQIVDNARRYPVMAQRQVIIVKEAQQLKGTELLASYFKAMNPSCVLVLCFMGKSVDKRTEFWKAAQKHCRILESVPLRDYEIPDWISAYLKEKGTSIEPQAARLLADFLGTDLQRIVMEIDKLFILMPQGTWAVTTDMVEKSVGVNREFSPFSLFKHITAGDFAKVQPIVEYFSDNEKKFPLVMIISLFYTQLSRILKLHTIRMENPGLSSDKLRELMGLNYYFFQETMQASRFFTFQRTVRAMNLLCSYDSLYKSSDRGEACDGELLMEMICKMMA